MVGVCGEDRDGLPRPVVRPRTGSDEGHVGDGERRDDFGERKSRGRLGDPGSLFRCPVDKIHNTNTVP